MIDGHQIRLDQSHLISFSGRAPPPPPPPPRGGGLFTGRSGIGAGLHGVYGPSPSTEGTDGASHYGNACVTERSTRSTHGAYGRKVKVVKDDRGSNFLSSETKTWLADVRAFPYEDN